MGFEAKRRKIEESKQFQLPSPAIHNILDFLPTQEEKIRLHHVSKCFYYCQYPWKSFFIPEHILKNASTVIQKYDALDITTKESNPFGQGLSSYEKSLFSRKILQLNPYWNFSQCDILILRTYNVLTISCMHHFKLVNPKFSKLQFKLPLKSLTAQIIARLKKRLELLELTIIDEQRILPLCKCKRMISIQDSGFCYACAPTLSECVALSQRYLIDCGMKSLASMTTYSDGY